MPTGCATTSHARSTAMAIQIAQISALLGHEHTNLTAIYLERMRGLDSHTMRGSASGSGSRSWKES